MDENSEQHEGPAAERPFEAQRNTTEIIVAAVAGAVANPVVADAYEAVKDVIHKGVDKIRGPRADPPLDSSE